MRCEECGEELNAAELCDMCGCCDGCCMCWDESGGDDDYVDDYGMLSEQDFT